MGQPLPFQPALNHSGSDQEQPVVVAVVEAAVAASLAAEAVAAPIEVAGQPAVVRVVAVGHHSADPAEPSVDCLSSPLRSSLPKQVEGRHFEIEPVAIK